MSEQAANPNGFKFYHYDPSMGAAVLFIVLFLCTTLAHTYQMIRTKTWFLIPFVIGGHFQWIGYIGRVLSSNETPNWTLGPYIMQTLLLLLAPALYAASIYMELGRIIIVTKGDHLTLIRRTWLTKIFVGGDVISFLMQAAGGGIMSGKSANANKLGSDVLVGGLVVQLLFFGLFMVVALVYEITLKKKPTDAILSSHIPWKKHLWTLYAVSVLILIRSVFRLIEYVQGNDGYLLSKEVFLYVFDSTLMFAVMAIVNWVHPSEIKAHIKGGNYFANAYKMDQMGTRHDLEAKNAGYRSESSGEQLRGTYENLRG